MAKENKIEWIFVPKNHFSHVFWKSPSNPTYLQAWVSLTPTTHTSAMGRGS